MKVDEILGGFQTLFPEWMDSVVGYQRFGSRSIVLYFEGDRSLIFYYNNMEDWTFGTRAFRKIPKGVNHE